MGFKQRLTPEKHTAEGKSEFREINWQARVRGGETRLCTLEVEPTVLDLGAKVRFSDMATGKALG